ncbi:hypothetical protein K466DRAFT_22620 [Polyporus arcularius HHB13444]|uniref:Uncharacterized protein n=1 Tax=Polyporus arcularius HHB13444 TaxID=1314778 RepID=A0A5C3PZ25_9APHY|nr:hypothetical protein K466DRAFT_22620 [Polyporus arcularius HHB13444]
MHHEAARQWMCPALRRDTRWVQVRPCKERHAGLVPCGHPMSSLRHWALTLIDADFDRFTRMGSRSVECPTRRCSQSRSWLCTQCCTAAGRFCRLESLCLQVTGQDSPLSHPQQDWRDRYTYVFTAREFVEAAVAASHAAHVRTKQFRRLCRPGKGRIDASRLHPSSLCQLRTRRHLPGECATLSLRAVRGSRGHPTSRPYPNLRSLLDHLLSARFSRNIAGNNDGASRSVDAVCCEQDPQFLATLLP